MAKKKSKGGAKPSPLGPKSVRLVVLCRPAYKTWLDKFLAFEKATLPALFDQMMAERAETKGFKPPPER